MNDYNADIHIKVETDLAVPHSEHTHFQRDDSEVDGDDAKDADYETVFSAKPYEQIEMGSRTRASAEQFIALLSFMERHGDLTKPQPGPHGRIRSDQMWLELTESLNSLHGGVSKTLDKWKKVWADWKTKTKKKAQEVQRRPHGLETKIVLTALEKRLLAVMGLMSVQRRFKIVKMIKRKNEKVPLIKQAIEEVNCASLNIPIEYDISRLTQPSQHSSEPRTKLLKQNQKPQNQTPTPHKSLQNPPENKRKLKKRSLNPFNQATRLFAAVERRRLRIEEMRARNEARRIEVEHERNEVFSRLANIAQAWVEHQISRDSSSRS